MSERKKESKPRRIRGEGALYQRGDGMWVGSVDLGWHGGKRVRKSVSAKTKKACQAKFLDLKKETEKGWGLSENISVEEWLNHWLEYIVSERNEATTLESYTSWTNTWLIPYLGHYRLDKLKEDHIRTMLAEMKKQGRSEGTRRRTHAVLHRALVVAMQERRITRNPAHTMDAPSTDVINRTPLTIIQAKQILANLDGDPLAARWVAALLQGMRQGECLALKWDDIDFTNETISINQSQVRLKKEAMSTKAPKSKSSTRVIPMIGPMRYALEGTERRGEFVFYGSPKDRKVDWKNWKELLVSAGICDAGMAKGDMPELASARTTTVTLLRDAGVDRTVIRDIMGHSQVSVTEESYMRTDALTMAKAMKALELSVAPSPKKVAKKRLPKPLGNA